VEKLLPLPFLLITLLLAAVLAVEGEVQVLVVAVPVVIEQVLVFL
jgi:hypothetical protein